MIMITITITKEIGSKIISFTQLLCKQLKCDLFTDLHKKDNWHFKIISLLTMIMMTFVFLWKKMPMTSCTTRSYECEDDWKSNPCSKQLQCRHRIARSGQLKPTAGNQCRYHWLHFLFFMRFYKIFLITLKLRTPL